MASVILEFQSSFDSKKRSVPKIVSVGWVFLQVRRTRVFNRVDCWINSSTKRVLHERPIDERLKEGRDSGVFCDSEILAAIRVIPSTVGRIIGKVLVCGGQNGGGMLNSAEVYSYT